MRDRADLHTHSHYSDGEHSPTEVVTKAVELGLGGLALTDHDTLNGLREFMNAKALSHLQRIPGIEISTDSGRGEAHLLGYFVPLESEKLQRELWRFKEIRRARFPKMVKRLSDIGIELQPEGVQRVMEEVDVPGRPHLARLLVQEGFVKDMNEAFSKYLAEGRPAYIKRDLVTLHEGISLLRSVGAVPVLAHPFTIEINDMESFLNDLRNNGLLGVEVEYRYTLTRTNVDIPSLRAITSDLGLIMTGGSDYHGEGSHNALGCATVSVEIIDALIEARESL